MSKDEIIKAGIEAIPNDAVLTYAGDQEVKLDAATMEAVCYKDGTVTRRTAITDALASKLVVLYAEIKTRSSIHMGM